MKVRESLARRLLKALGYDNADNYGPKVVARKLEAIEVNTTDQQKLSVKEADLKRLLLTVMRSVKHGDGVELVTADFFKEKASEPLQTFANKVAQNTKEAEGGRQKAGGTDQETRQMVEEENAVAVGGNSISTEKGEEVNDDRAREKVGGFRQKCMEQVLEESDNQTEAKEPNFQKAKEVLTKSRLDRSPGIDLDDIFATAHKAKETEPDEFPGLRRTVEPTPGEGTVRRTIFNMLRDASEQEPVSKPEVLEVVERKFPDHKPSSLKASVDGFPHWLPRCFPFSVHQTDKKYWIQENRE